MSQTGKLSDIQLTSLFESDARINILEGSVRSGKTHVSMIRWIDYLINPPPGDLLMLGKTYGTLTRNIILPLQRMIGTSMRFYSSKNLVRWAGRDIYCYGANTKDSAAIIQGMTAAGALGDEVSLWPEEVFKMMLSRLSVTGSKFFGATNPDSPYHWLKRDFLDRASDLDLKRFKYKLEDNFTLNRAYVEALKKEYTGLWYRRYIDGEWCLAEGAIYDFFDSVSPYVKSIMPRPKYFVVGVDYGTQNPTVFILFGVNPSTKPRIWAIKEYYYDGRAELYQKTDAEYSADMRAWLGDVKPRKIFVDPSAASFIIQLKKDGLITATEHTNNSVLDGIRTQARMLKLGEYSISPNCKHTVEEYGTYLWDEKAQERGEDKPIKRDDHTKDAERYVLHTMFGSVNLNSVLNRL